MRLLGVLPFFTFVALATALRQRGWAASFRDALVIAGVNTAAWALAAAEILSLFHALAFWPLLIWWGLPAMALACFCWRSPRLILPERTRDPVTLAAMGLMALLFAFTFLTGLLAVPSNWDALSYHLPRQVYWIQQQHVGFFSTADIRMLTMPPLTEYIGAQVMILAGGDYWAHSIQWLTYGLCAATVSIIARDLGLNARWQALTALLMVTIPPAAFQAANTKNDLVTAFCLCALAFFALQLIVRENLSSLLVWHLGACGGLLLLSKGTGMIFGLPIAIWILCALFAKHRFLQTLRVTAAATAVAGLLAGPFFFRAHLRSNSPLKENKKNYQVTLLNQIFTPQAFASNLFRNTAMHIATGSPRINSVLTSTVGAFHRCIGIDLNDPRTTYGSSPPYRTEWGLRHEDLAKAPVHVLVAIPAFFLLAAGLFRRQSMHQWLISSFLLLPFFAFFTFCFFLSWQVWHSRLHIPALCLLSPAVVFAVAPRFLRLLLAACAVAVALAFYATLKNSSKPLLGKSSVITNEGKRSKMHPAGGLEAAKAVATLCRTLRPKVLGLVAQPNQCEYTLLRTLLKNLDYHPQFVKLNMTWRKPAPAPEPDLVVSWYMPSNTLPLKLSTYSLILTTNSVNVYVPKRNDTKAGHSPVSGGVRSDALNLGVYGCNIQLTSNNLRL